MAMTLLLLMASKSFQHGYTASLRRPRCLRRSRSWSSLRWTATRCAIQPQADACTVTHVPTREAACAVRRSASLRMARQAAGRCGPQHLLVPSYSMRAKVPLGKLSCTFLKVCPGAADPHDAGHGGGAGPYPPRSGAAVQRCARAGGLPGLDLRDQGAPCQGTLLYTGL